MEEEEGSEEARACVVCLWRGGSVCIAGTRRKCLLWRRKGEVSNEGPARRRAVREKINEGERRGDMGLGVEWVRGF